ncbi:MAG: malate synthase A [Ardenticatenaceae bacterium]|nr:malate synthase A [Anaerolineales bacterium]MCB8922468.1 malate synthase A [Ardenticatenaceae bacterium]MCB8989937.1 malate synthase A [Ardenticatenaceae bacterium]
MTISTGMQILGEVPPEFGEILTPQALALVAKLERTLGQRRRGLLQMRVERQLAIDAGKMPDFLPETKQIRESDWQVAPIPADLQDRRVEITGPVDRKMVINALNSGASVYMADFEDSHSPTWQATIEGQINLRDAVRETITFTNPNGKFYELGEETAVLMVRPRGWHLEEKHVLLDGQPVSASLFDFALFFFHNVKALLDKGTGPYFYLPKLESHLEARLWNDAFNLAQDELDIPRGTIRATVLIENILATFEMDEILWELKDHSAGLNCGRWDYIFSMIRKFRNHPEFVMPNRAQVTMTTHMMHSYSLLTIKTCHRRGIHAMGGMAAQIPIKGDDAANEAALEKVRKDKEREAKDGHDGTWVAHPGLVAIAKAEFDQYMPTPNQIHVRRDDVHVTTQDLLTVPQGTITEEGLRINIDVGILYMASWLDGNGCVPIYNLMEDAATAEISRSQLWQWVNNENAVLEDGRPINADLYREMAPQVLADIKTRVGADVYNQGKYELAAELFEKLITGKEFTDFLTLSAYEFLN